MPRRKLLRSKVARPSRRQQLISAARTAGRMTRGVVRLGAASTVFRRATKTDRFNPLTALAQSYLQKRKAPVTRTSSKKRKLAVKSMPKNRIGSNAGLIVSNQRVPRPKKGSVQYRRSVYGTASAQDKVWIGGSSIGQQSTHFRTIAHAILAHYLPKMGDIRATNIAIPTTAGKVFGRYQMKYASDAPSTGTAGALVNFKLGAQLADSNYEIMALQLGDEMATLAGEGFYPFSIRFDTPDLLGVKLEDVNLGRHTITVSCKGRFRFQNVTAAEGDAGGNINAVDANPVSGKIFTFRNQAPLFANGYKEPQDAATKLGFNELQTVSTPFEMYGAQAKGNAAFILPAPPLNPSSVWRNVSSTGQVSFPPGGFKTFTTSYLRSETIAKYCQNISQADLLAGVADHNAQYPPAGDSFMMCLRPTIKTTSETIKMAYDTEYTLMASIKRRRVSPLQVVNDIE